MELSFFCDERENFLFYLVFQAEIQKKKSFLLVERNKIKLILTRIPGIKNFCWALCFRPSFNIQNQRAWKNPTPTPWGKERE